MALSQTIMNDLFQTSHYFFSQLYPICQKTSLLSVVNKLVDSSRILVILNPDHYTAWNFRKKHLLNIRDCKYDQRLNFLQSIDYELSLTNLILSSRPKSTQVWAHRTWLTIIFNSCKLELSPQYQKVCSNFNFKKQIQQTSKYLENYKRNYYCWKFRLYLLNSLNLYHDLLYDLEFTWSWIKIHISDASASHHIVQILNRMASFYPPTFDTICLIQNKIIKCSDHIKLYEPDNVWKKLYFYLLIILNKILINYLLI